MIALAVAAGKSVRRRRGSGRVERGHRLRSTEQHGTAVLLEVCRDWVGMNVASMDVGKARFVLPRAKEMDLMTSRLIEESQSRLTQCSPR